MSTKTRLWVLITGVLCALVVLYGVMVGLLPQFQQASQIRGESDTTEFLIQTQEAQLQRLQQADSESAELEKQLAELEVSIPTSPDWAEFLRQLQVIQGATGAIATQIVASDAVLPEAAVEEVAAGETEGAVADITATESAAPVTNLIAIPITMTVAGDASQVAEFVRQLQLGKRLFTAQSVDIDTSGETPTANVVGAIYVTP